MTGPSRGCASTGWTAADSDANFVLFGMFDDRHAVWQGLLDRGVLIREVGPGRLAAGVDRDAGGDARVPGRAGGGHRLIGRFAAAAASHARASGRETVRRGTVLSQAVGDEEDA